METVSLNELVAFMTIIVGIVTVIWFIRDVRKQNSKELKNQSQILLRIDENQLKLARILENSQKSLERIEKSSEATVKSLEGIQKSSERMEKNSETQTKILEKIEAK